MLFAQSNLRAIQVFFISFFAYTSVHSLRTTYASNKHFIGQSLSTTKLYLGFLDSAMLICLGIGHFMHVVTAQKRPVFNLKIALILIAATFLLISQIAIHFKQALGETLVLILIMINGFLQSYTWPNLLMVVGEYFSNQRESTQLGFWSSCGNFGNIFGYLISGFVVKQGWHWNHAFTISACFIVVSTLLVHLRIDEIGTTNQAENHDMLINQQPKKQVEIAQVSFIQSIKVIFYSPKVMVYCIIFALSKSVIYGLLLWLPIYFQDKELNTYAQIVPIFYDLSAIVGSVVLGKVFPLIKIKGAIFAPITVVLLAAFVLLKVVNFGSIVGYLIIISFIGAFLGGMFNLLGSVVTISLTEVIPKQNTTKYIGIYSALINSFGNFTTALTQILIGFVASQNQSFIFVIFGVYQLLVVIASLVLICIEINQRKKRNQEAQS